MFLILKSRWRLIAAAVVISYLVGIGSTLFSSGSVGSSVSDTAAAVPRALGVTQFADAAKNLVSPTSSASSTKPKKKHHKKKAGQKANAFIDRAVDGDTFAVTLASGKSADVRLLGIDSPERVRPNYPHECGSDGASNAAHRIADQQPVRLSADPTQDSVDRYGRLLRYARIGGKDYGELMLKKGWVAPYVYDDNPIQKIDAYRQAAELSKSKSRGVWGKCGGNFHSAASEPWSGD